MQIKVWVKCAPNPAAAKHPSFFFVNEAMQKLTDLNEE